MNQDSTASLKLAYSLVILGAILPIGLANSGWVAMTIGGGPFAAWPIIGPLAMLVLGLYRVYLVARIPGTLCLSPVGGFARLLRRFGVLMLYVGAIVGILNLVSVPLMKALVKSRSESGVEFYVAGTFLGLLGGIGIAGLMLFELSRLIGFETQAAGQASADDDE